jgi:hypothetical protein
VTFNLPQVETWTSNSFRARAVVGVKPAGAKKESLGVIWFEAHGSGDRTNRVVTLDRMEITKGRFPDATDNGSNALALVRELCPGGARTMSLDCLLLSGRWFKTSSLRGPWTYVAPHDLPADFSKIPPGSPQAVVLASVPDTPQAELAMVANSVPTTATVNRRDAKIELKYDGEPRFMSIEGTTMSYAVNAQLPVVQLGTNYYAVDDAVWFVAASPTGPWEVAIEVPEEIYTIPPSSPVFYATFVHVYDADDEKVETGYTPGYTGSYEDDGTTVYGTGYDYEPWYGNNYYGWGWTWGYSYWYVPW